jgi:hypothetical protein
LLVVVKVDDDRQTCSSFVWSSAIFLVEVSSLLLEFSSSFWLPLVIVDAAVVVDVDDVDVADAKASSLCRSPSVSNAAGSSQMLVDEDTLRVYLSSSSADDDDDGG